MFSGLDFDGATSKGDAPYSKNSRWCMAIIPVWLGNAYISGCMQDSNIHWRAIFTFLRTRNTNTVQQVWKLSDICVSDKTKKWPPWTASAYYISRLVCVITTDFQRHSFHSFSGSRNTTGLVRILSDLWLLEEAKMAAMNRKCVRNSVHLSLYAWSERNFYGNPTGLL